MHSLPIFVRLAGRAVMLLGQGEAADAKRRLLERAGAVIVGEEVQAALAIVAIEDEDAALAAVERLKARGVLVNAVDRPALCDFTLPAIVDRDPVLVAIGTGGSSAGLAAALRQRLEALLPAQLGELATALLAARGEMRARWPDPAARRRALAAGLGAGGPIDPLGVDPDLGLWLNAETEAPQHELVMLRPRSADPDDLTLREARALAQADRVYHPIDAPAAILDRARADADRIIGTAPAALPPGLSVQLEMPA
ncbi:bifunctional precorrin-2 dehydrogenase/sirohydrochlorin ferrochelatase [Sphingomonas sp. 28-63-12]|uniref:precorrin-2 dehydrogenase/sirohydrochlorin ferrochelatase family protein n=1 Tax=Sphingomonas sp. 28-63-12 TaxID=1970434 RepID=UPI000BDC9225|nr:MAG: siroheme synthase [Sphingomonas sp. 28-63-12]